MRAAGSRAQDGERRSGQRVSQKRGHRCGHARNSAFAAARPDEAEGPGENRTGFNEANPARALDRLEPLAHLARAPPLLRAQARLQPVRSFQTLSEREAFLAYRSGAKLAGDEAFLARKIT